MTGQRVRQSSHRALPQWDRWPQAWRRPPTGRSWARRCCGSSRKDWHCHRSRVEARAPAGSGSNTMPSSNCDPTHPAQCTLDDFYPPARIRARRPPCLHARRNRHPFIVIELPSKAMVGAERHRSLLSMKDEGEVVIPPGLGLQQSVELLRSGWQAESHGRLRLRLGPSTPTGNGWRTAP